MLRIRMHTMLRVPGLYRSFLCSRRNAHSAALHASALQPLEHSIGAGLLPRLPAESPHRVAVVGRPSSQFLVAMRAARGVGAAVAPIDVQHCTGEELVQRLAEAQVQVAMSAGASDVEEKSIHNAAHQLGAIVATLPRLCMDGEACELPSGIPISETPFMFFSRPPWATAAHAAEVSEEATQARVKTAIERWKYTKEDVVVSFGLAADSPVAVIDALQAPLAEGAAVVIPPPPRSSNQEVWQLWSSLLNEADSSVLFVSSEWCSRILEAHVELAPKIREELASRWRARPLRHTVAMAQATTMPSTELATRWLEVFQCPLTWQFGTAEAGALFSVTSNDAAQLTGTAADGLDWQVDDDELWVRGDGLFSQYYGRPRSTVGVFGGPFSAAADGQSSKDSLFCRTGHHVMKGTGGGLLPMEPPYDGELEDDMARHLYHGPHTPGHGMEPDWKIKRVKMRKYWFWRGKGGGHKIYTLKHNNVGCYYHGKYK